MAEDANPQRAVDTFEDRIARAIRHFEGHEPEAVAEEIVAVLGLNLTDGERDAMAAMVRHVKRNVEYDCFGMGDRDSADPFAAIVRLWPEVDY